MTDAINALKEQLHILRETARYLLQQAAAHGSEIHLPPEQRHRLDQTRASIARCKAELRARQVPVDDAPEDSPPPAASATETELDAALVLLDQLPLDEIPPRQELPALHRTKQMRGTRHFVGRDDELRLLARQLKAGGTVVVTTGIGGMGKTQLVIEAMHRYGRYFAGGVFWLSFATPEGIPQEVAECGREMGLAAPGEQVDQDELVRRTRRAWKSKLPRLLIFDNCDDHTDPDDHSKPGVQADALLAEWLPEGSGCRVLVTSRRQGEWSPELDLTQLPLDELARADSIDLLQRLAPRLSPDEADQIAQELGGLPLALYLAGRYLRTQKSIAAETYLAKLRSPDLLQHPSLTGHGVAEQPTGRELHVVRTFALSFDQLNPHASGDILARQLLARAACFAPGEPFAQEWLEATVEVAGDEEAQQRACTDATNRLLALGLLEQDGEMLRLHRLLAAFALHTLRDDAALPAVERVVNEVVYQANETKVPQAMLSVLPHLRHLVQQAGEREDGMTATLCNQLGFYLQTVGAFAEAQPLYERGLAISERVLGSDHPDTATSLNNLAALYGAQGTYEWALPLFERALAIHERALGTDHPTTATSLNNLALLLEAQGAYERALPLYERALVIQERVLGNDHPSTANSLNNLAHLFQAQGAYERALPLFERALAVHERVLGSDHPSTAMSLNNLAELYRAQGEDEQALPLLERALAIKERVLGSDHPTTATSLNNLALLFQAQGAYERALPLFERALAISERVLGSDHPDTAQSLNNLAVLYKAQGAYERALPLYERALAVRERVLGSDHPGTAESLNNLALLYAKQSQFATALPLLERALHIWQARLGPQHPHTVKARQSLAAIHRDATIAALPKAVRAAVEAEDSKAFEQALGALPPEQAQAVVAQLQAAGILGDSLEEFAPLLEAIAAVAQGDTGPRAQVEVVLAQLEQRGFHLTTATLALWGGQRDPAALTAGLDDTDAALIRRVLALLQRSTS